MIFLNLSAARADFSIPAASESVRSLPTVPTAVKMPSLVRICRIFGFFVASQLTLPFVPADTLTSDLDKGICGHVSQDPLRRSATAVNRVIPPFHLERPAATPAGVTLYVALARRQQPQENRDSTRINQNIRISPIRVVSEEGEQLGIIPTEDALERARDAGLDLVEVAPNERPPVCRIMDYGKFKYEKNKKSGGKSAQTKTKEIRLRPKTGDEDIRTKIRRAEKFLGHKDKVQVTVMFRGREMAHIEEGRRVMQMVLEELSEFGKIEAPPQQNGRRMIAMLSPK